LVKEKELILRLEELYKYRSNGITRHEECVEFEKFKHGIHTFRGNKRLQDEMLGTLDEAEFEGDTGIQGVSEYLNIFVTCITCIHDLSDQLFADILYGFMGL